VVNEKNAFLLAAESADNILRQIADQQFRDPNGSPLDNINTDCEELRAAIIRRMLQGGPTTSDDVISIDQTLRAKRHKKFVALLAKGQRCRAKSDNLKLFRVENRAGRSIKVAAVDAECARMFAQHSGHVQEQKNAKVFVYKDEWLATQKEHGTAIWRALKEGIPGVLKEVGSHVMIESRGKVYTPLSPVIAPHLRFARD
jgi:hypothetical protein